MVCVSGNQVFHSLHVEIPLNAEKKVAILIFCMKLKLVLPLQQI